MSTTPPSLREITSASGAATVGGALLSSLAWYALAASSSAPWLPIAILTTVLTLAGAVTFGVGKLLATLPLATSPEETGTPDTPDYPAKPYL